MELLNSAKTITGPSSLYAFIKTMLQSGSATVATFSFNRNTGNIEYAGKGSLKAISLTSSKHFGVSDNCTLICFNSYKKLFKIETWKPFMNTDIKSISLSK